MLKDHKFKYGDIVYVKCYLWIDYLLGKIIRFDDKINMYVMIEFLETSDPESFWAWCYVKEDDIDFANKIINTTGYEKCFNFDVRLYPRKFDELYTEEYRWAKMVSEGKLSRQEYYMKVREDFEKNKKLKK